MTTTTASLPDGVAATVPDDVKLTPRQLDVFKLMQADKTPTEIGAALGISSQGVHGHLNQLRRHKLVPGEYKERARATGNRLGRPTVRRAGITATDAFESVRASIETQKAQLAARATELDTEVADLKAAIESKRAEKRQVEKAATDLATFEKTLPAAS